MKPDYTQSPAGAARDQAARFAYDEELTHDERRDLMNAAQPLLELRQMGEVGLAELLYALCQAGYVKALHEAEHPDKEKDDGPHTHTNGKV